VEPAACFWVSATPFVPPGNRRRWRRNGRARSGETPVKLLAKLLVKSGFPEPVAVEAVAEPARPESVCVHVSRRERRRVREQGAPALRAGYWFRLRFAAPIAGPICVGHSAHFGLGLFLPAADGRLLQGVSEGLTD
jgi:CRISPR-associated protein Csb2